MDQYFYPNYARAGESTQENLFCGGFVGTPRQVNLKPGVVHVRGDILQESATAGVYELCDTPEKAIYVLVEHRDLSEEADPQVGVVYMTGEFNRSGVRVAEGADFEAVATVLEARNLYFRKTVGVLKGY